MEQVWQDRSKYLVFDTLSRRCVSHIPAQLLEPRGQTQAGDTHSAAVSIPIFNTTSLDELTKGWSVAREAKRPSDQCKCLIGGFKKERKENNCRQ